MRYYIPSETGNYIEHDEETIVNNKLQKTGRKIVLPVTFWEQEPEKTMKNLSFYGMNPKRVRRANLLDKIRNFCGF